MLYCKKNKDYEQFGKILETIRLNDTNKEIIRQRYLTIIQQLQKRTTKYSQIYFLGHIIITVGSLFVPALLSIQYADTGDDQGDGRGDFQIQIFWTTWTVSLLVTIFNGILTLFRVDKKYFFLNTILERLRSEGWQYFELTGRYSGQYNTEPVPTYENQFKLFCYHIEKLKMKQITEEFFKPDEKAAQNPLSNGITDTSNKNNYSITHLPSPNNPIKDDQENIPSPVREAVNSLIQSRKIRSRSSTPTRQSVSSIHTEISDNNSIEMNRIIENMNEYNSDNTVIIVERPIK